MGMSMQRMEAELVRLLRKRLRKMVRAHLATCRTPHSTWDLAIALEVPFRSVRLAVCQLVASGALVAVGRNTEGRLTYRPVEIGPCEWCGLVSHRLVAGECPACQRLTREPETLTPYALQEPSYEH